MECEATPTISALDKMSNVESKINPFLSVNFLITLNKLIIKRTTIKNSIKIDLKPCTTPAE